MHTPASFVALAFALVANAAIGPTSDLHISNKVIAPDGFPRSAVVVNGISPGPIIAAQKGDRFRLNVINELNDTSMDVDTSVHWHGIYQRGSNWADGTDMVTQCPIIPGQSFLYEFSSGRQAGTFWYHSHLQAQYCDGLRGPLIVYDPNDPYKSLYDVDNDSTVLLINDWYHLPSPQILGAPTADSTIFNGLGRSKDNVTSPLFVFEVEQGKRYRIRLLNGACDTYFDFQIPGHSFTIIEADGENTEPLVVDSLRILAGQRYSIVLNANQSVDNYWIRADPNPHSALPGFDGGRNSAILRYRGAPISEPTQNTTATTPTETSLPLVEANLHPLERPSAPGIHMPGTADHNITLEFNVDMQKAVFTVNGTAFQAPSVPILMQILSGAYTAQDLLPSELIYTLRRNKVVELTMLPMAAGGPHPMHLHGHAFYVVKSAGSSTYNYANPVRRDTVALGVNPGDNVVIRFTTDNPGPWFLHCHIDWHLKLGFAAVFAEDPAGVNRTNRIPPAWNQLCPTYAAARNSTANKTPATNLRVLPVKFY